MNVEEMTPAERLGYAAGVLYERLCEEQPEKVADAHALIDLDSSLRGMQVRYCEESDVFDVVWTGRYVGSIPGAFVRGESW